MTRCGSESRNWREEHSHYETLVLKAKLHQQMNHIWRAKWTLKKILREPSLTEGQRHHVSTYSATWMTGRTPAGKFDCGHLNLWRALLRQRPESEDGEATKRFPPNYSTSSTTTDLAGSVT